MKYKNFIFLALAIFFPACKATYSREKIKEEVAALAQKDYGLKMGVYENGDTFIARYYLKNLRGELVAEDQKLWQDADHILLVLSRVTLSMENPPKFFVLDIVDADNPRIQFSFTRYIEDIKKYMAEAISTSQYFDSIVMEFAIGNERKVFDPNELDYVRFLMMALAAEEDSEAGKPVLEYLPQEVKFQDFLAKVAANHAKRSLRENSDVKKNFFLRQVLGEFEANSAEFRFVIDLAPRTTEKAASLFLDKTAFPLVAAQTREIFKSYKFRDFSKILVTEKHSGKMMEFGK